MKVVYKATSAGPLKWELGFSPALSGTYRLIYTWMNVTNSFALHTADDSFEANYRATNYTFTWADVPKKFNTTGSIALGQFALRIDLGSLAGGSQTIIDPSISTSTSGSATSYTFQRKIFFEPKGGYFFVFYYDGNSEGYRYSHDGTTWSSLQSMPSGWPTFYNVPTSSLSVLNSGQNVLVATGQTKADSFTCGSTPCSGSDSVSLYYSVGTISGPTINWQPDSTGHLARIAATVTSSFTSSSTTSFSATIGIRYASVALSATNIPTFSFNFFEYQSPYSANSGVCSTSNGAGVYAESGLYVAYNGIIAYVAKNSILTQNPADCYRYDLYDNFRSALAASDSVGGMRVVFQHPVHTYDGFGDVIGTRVELDSLPVFRSQTSTVPAIANAYVDSSQSNSNFGSALSVGSSPSGSAMYKGFVNFNLPQTPSGYSFNSASLSFGLVAAAGSGAVAISPCLALSSWTEFGITWANQPTYASCSSVGPYYSLPGGTTPQIVQGSYTVDATPSVRLLYAGTTNHGLELTPYWTSGSNGYMAFYSYENVGQACPGSPCLSVTFVSMQLEMIESSMSSDPDFSLTSDANYGTHIVYKMPDNTISYTYRSISSASWLSPSRNIFGGPDASPTIVADYSTNDVYAIAINGSSIIMRSKGLAESWADRSIVFPVTRQNAPSSLGSNLASASSTNASTIQLIWTAGSSSPYNVTFASIPIETVWSPYAAPTDPWDGNGLAPYGQYFANLGEYVSPSTGMLTIKQTDLSVPGRGLSLDLARVYTEPGSFLNGNPFNYESSYGFWDDSFTTGWTAYSTINFATHGDVATLTVNSASVPYGQIVAFVNINTAVYPYLVWRFIGSNRFNVGVFAGGVEYKYAPPDPLAPSTWSTVAWNVNAVTGGKTITEIEVFAVGNVGDWVKYDYIASIAPFTMGNGWHLNFPWMNGAATPSFIHLWDGEGYRIPSSFWTGLTASFDNHQGENFRLVRNLDGSIVLFTSTGTSYSFNSSHLLTTITDSTGNNAITFQYDASNYDRLSYIGDAVGRLYWFHYYDSSGLPMLVRSINETITGLSTTRSIGFVYDGKLRLVSMKDPAGRVTGYAYGGIGGAVDSWLTSQIDYPTGWYDSYSYTQYTIGTQASTYRVSLQQVMASSTSNVRQFAYVYIHGAGDQITGSTVTTYNGTRVAGYTKYAFSYLGDIKNITDASGNLLSGDEQFFGVNGEIPREVVLVTDGSGQTGPGHIGSYTNYYTYDLWGNQIYSRRVINPTSNWYHESFNAYYNNAEPPGFYSFQDSFSRNQGISSDNSWNVANGYWMVNNGVYNGTPTTGPEESVLSYASVTKTDVSIQARVFLVRLVNTTADSRVGIFTHYAGGPLYHKWELVIHTASQYSYLEFNDEWNGWLGENDGQSSAQSSCSAWNIPLISTGIWYTFNMTVRGTSALGWVSAPGQPQCTVTGTFGSTSPALNGTGFGMFASTFSALFDDVQVATVSPFITGLGFSNSFIRNGAPGPVGLNTWMATTKPPGAGWNTTVDWLSASGWNQAYPSQNYGASPWGTLTGWPDNNAQWIWSTANANVSASLDPVWFRRTFTVSATSSLSVAIATDDTYVVYLDGSKLGTGNHWEQVGSYTSTVNPGYHILSISATNAGGPAGLLITVKNTGTGQVIFRSDATAGPAIGALAGSAQLQNGSGSLPEETYYGYTMWGGINQTKTRLDTNASPIFIDNTAQTGCGHNTNSCSLIFNTSQPNDIIVVFTTELLDLQTSCTFTVTDTSGLSWTMRGSASGRNDGSTGGNRDQLGEFWAKSVNKLSSDTITESISGCAGVYGGEYNGLIVIGISGANFSNPFDSNSSLPGSTNGNSNLPSATISTSNSRDMVIGIAQQSSYGVLTSGPGFAPISYSETCCQTSQEDLVYSTLTNFNVAFGDNTAYYWEEIADAVQAGVGPSQTQWITTTRSYDQYGNLLNIVDPKGNSTSYGYSTKYQSAYLTSQTQTQKPGPISVVSSFGYNFTTGTMIWAQQPNGYNTHNYNTTSTYDILGRLTKVTYPTGDFLAYTYNDAGNYVNITNENGLKTKDLYDGLGRLASTQRFLNGAVYSTSGSTYNWMNEVTSSTDPLGNRYSYTYDALGRMNMTIEPNGNHTQAFYNGVASWVRYANEYQNSRCNIYDRLGRLVSVIEEADTNCLTGIVTNYYYDEAGDLIEVRNANQAATFYAYDSLSRLIQTTKADGTTDSYIYDSNGNVVRKVNQNAVKTLLSYDSLNRPLTVTYCGSPVTSQSYSYDSNSNILSLQSQNSTIQYTYDSRNRPLSEEYDVNHLTRQVVDLGCFGVGGTSTTTGGLSKTYTVAYSFSGEMLSGIVYPTTSTQNIAVNYTYDGLGRILSVYSSYTTYARFSYFQNDQIKGIQYGNGLIANYTYDPMNRIRVQQLNNTSLHTNLLKLSYTYNNTGTVSSVVGSVSGVTVNEQYRYDPLQRLTNSTVTSQGASNRIWYTYDNVGNRLQQSLNGTTTSYLYTLANNELASSSSPGTSTSYSYDRNGNLVSKTTGSVTWTYTWDVANHLLKAGNGTTQGMYAYDARGRMLESRVGSANIYFAYTGTDMLWQNGTDFVYANSMKVSWVGVSSLTTPRFYHTDQLGSVRLTTRYDATVEFTDNYQPFGQDNGKSTGFQRPPSFEFQGMPLSTRTGLYYDYQRWYDPTIGRFISQDPIRGGLETPQSLNQYVYAQDSPTTITDPSGLYVQPLMAHRNTSCDLNWSSVTDYFASYWHSLSTAQCWGFGPGGTVTGAYGGNTVGAGPAGAGIAGIITVIWVIDNWDSISNMWRTPPPGPGGSGDGSNGGTGPPPITTTWITGGIGPITTFPGTESLTAGIGPSGTSALTSRPTGNLAIDNIYGTLAKPIRWVKNHPNIGRLCVAGAVVAGLGLFAWQIGESARQTRGSLDPRGDIGIVLAGCLVGIGFLALIPT